MPPFSEQTGHFEFLEFLKIRVVRVGIFLNTGQEDRARLCLPPPCKSTLAPRREGEAGSANSILLPPLGAWSVQLHSRSPGGLRPSIHPLVVPRGHNPCPAWNRLCCGCADLSRLTSETHLTLLPAPFHFQPNGSRGTLFSRT